MIEIVVMELFSFLFLSRWQERITTTDSARRVLFFPRHADTIFVFLILGVKFWGVVKSNVSDIIFPNEMKCSSLVAALTRNLATSPIESLLLKTI